MIRKFLYLLFVIALFCNASLYANDKKKIFILHSYSQEYQWTKGQHEGFVKELKKNYLQPLEISTEYLDTKRVQLSPEYRNDFLLYIQMKYKNYNPDAIYVSDDNALDFIVNNKKTLFSSSPVVFSGINNLSLRDSLDKKMYAGVYEIKEIEPNMNLIGMFSPQTRDVWFVGDASNTYASIKNEIEQKSAKFPLMKFHFISSKTIDEVAVKLSQIPPRSFVFLTTIGGFVDANGGNLTLQESIKRLSKLKNIILLSMEDAYVQEGVVGGYVTDGQKQGGLAAQILIKILNKKPPAQIESIMGDANSYIFDYKELKKSKLILSEYTARNAIVLNKEESFFASNQELIQRVFYLLFGVLIVSFGIIYLSIRREKQVLKDAESSYKGLFNSINHSVYIQNLSGNFVDVNDGALRMYGYTKEEMIGKTPEFLTAPDKNDLDTLEARIANAINGIPQRFEFWGMRKNGEIFPKDVSIVNGKYFGEDVLIVVAVDITKQKQLEENLGAVVVEETNKRIEKEKLLLQQSKMAMMGEMIGAIAHQWRQPLNSLALSVQDAHLVYEMGEINDSYMDGFKNDTMSIIQKMSSTIDDFRNFFKPKKKTSVFPIEKAIGETLNIIKAQLSSHFISVKLNYDHNGEHLVSGYQSELEQAILIIISNAQDAILLKNPQKPTIEISIRESENIVIVDIQDNGGGIPINIIDRIFEPYFTTKHQAHGTGIGLYMAKEIIERQMGGKISAKNSATGALFSIELKAHQE